MTTVKSLREISKHFTEELLLDILHREVGSDVTLTGISFSEGSGKGDNFMAGVHRVTVSASGANQQQVSLPLIVKCLPPNIGRRKTFKMPMFFRNETAFYNHVAPKLLKFQEARKVKNPFVALPKCYAAFCDGENDFIVLQDLCRDGYKILDKSKGIDYNHCELSLKELGRYHALSLAMKDQDPETLKEIAGAVEECYYFEGNREWYKGMLEIFCSMTLDAVNAIYPDSEYVSKFKQFTVNLYDRMMSYVLPKEPFAVMNHGDAWPPNYLFKYKPDGQLDSAKIIDFQLARYSSPILDLIFYVSTCTTRELRESKLEDLLRAYHTSLTEFLKELGSNPDMFTYEMFEKEFREYGAYGLGMAIEAVPFAMCDSEDAPDVDLLKGDEAVPLTQIWILKPLKRKEDKQRLADVVKFAVDWGFI